MGAGSSVQRRPGAGHGRRSSEAEAEAAAGGRSSSSVTGCWIHLLHRRSSSSMSAAPAPPRRILSSNADDTTVYGGRNFIAFEVNKRNDGSRLQNQQPAAGAAAASSSTLMNSILDGEEEVNIESQLRRFTYGDLKTATRNFRPDTFLGAGGFGRVHKAWIEENGTAPAKPGTGLPVAVKTLNCDGPQGHCEWVAEVHYLRNLRHPHLVKLIGFCIEGSQRQLVYEFMPRGSLENHLFRNPTPVPWSVRLKIVLGAAKGLTFLHEEIERPVIFRDLKTSNILLDAELNAKLSDFGLAIDGPEGDKTHVSTRVVGTYGYAAPEYVMTGHVTAMSDVYSFGVVLLEVLTGRKAMDKSRPEGEQHLVDWARPYFRDSRAIFHRLVDPQLGSKFSISGAQKLARLAHACLARDPKARPAMSQVVRALEPILQLQDMATSTGLYRNMQRERAAMLFSSPPPPAAPAAATPRRQQPPPPEAAGGRRRSLSHSPLPGGRASPLLQGPRAP